MWKALTIFLLIIIAFGIFFLVIYFWGGKSMGGLGLVFSEEDVSKFESVFSEKEFSELENEVLDKEFISPDGRIKMNYSSDWEEIKDENFLEKVFPEKTTEKYNLKVLFLAHYLKSRVFSQLYVAEGYFGNATGPEEIIDIFKKSGQEESLNVVVVNQELKNDKFIFEFICEKEGFPSFRFKELIILPKETEDKSYLITFVGPEKDWLKMENRAEIIIGSVEIID